MKLELWLLVILVVGSHCIFQSEAQCGKRNYDTFLQFEWEPNFNMSRTQFNQTALLVIDMQKDFTYGSFGLPCFNDTPNLYEIDIKIAKLIKFLSDQGAYIIASKDWHPEHHCSFEGEKPCLNPNSSFIQSYQNSFPPHCVHDNEGVPITWKSPNQYRGADFVTNVSKVMLPLVREGKADVVFKGFNQSWESFSAFSMGGGDVEGQFTGGHTPKSGPPANLTNLDNFYPSESEMSDPRGRMYSTASLLKARNITHVLVCGLVFDYCVRDTALFGLLSENMGPSTLLSVVADLTRPAMDGTTLRLPVFLGSNFFLGSPERIISMAGSLINHGVHLINSSMIYNASY